MSDRRGTSRRRSAYILARINARESLGKISVGGTTSFALSDLRSSENTMSARQVSFSGRNNLSEVIYRYRSWRSPLTTCSQMAFAPRKGSSGLDTFYSEEASRV